MQETSVLTEIAKSLIAAGPVATVLGIVVWQLWKQNKELLAMHQRQQFKMLKLAVRVQRAVEALAGLDTPAIEADLEDDEPRALPPPGAV